MLTGVAPKSVEVINPYRRSLDERVDVKTVLIRGEAPAR
jgi:hypothetical protein